MSIRPFNEGDTIALKDNRCMRILKVKYKDGSLVDIQRMEGMEDNAASPMRTVILPENFRRTIKRAPRAFDWELKRWAELQGDNSYKLIERREAQDTNYLKVFKIKADRRKERGA